MQLISKHLATIIIASSIATATYAASDTITDESKKLAYCEGVYLYTAQMLQIQNNNGAALNLLSRASRVTTANFFLNKQGNKITGERVGEIKLARRGVKERLDSDQSLALTEANECDKTTKPIISLAIKQGGTLWGKGFVELNQAMLEQYKKNLGIQ